MEIDISRAMAIWDTGRPSREAAQKRTTVAAGSWAADIPRMPAESSAHDPSQYKPPFAPQLLDLALKQLSYLYDRPPSRDVGDEDMNDWCRSHFWEFGAGLDSAMAEADRFARLHGEALLFGRYVADPDMPPPAPYEDGQKGREDEDGIEWIAFPRSHYEPIMNAHDPRFIDAAIIRIGGEGRDERLIIWTDTHISYVIGGIAQEIGPDGAESLEHGLGVLPCERVLNRASWSESLCPTGLGGADLLKNLNAVGGILREYGWTSKLARGQMWATAPLREGSLGPDTLLVFNEGTTFGIASSGADLAGMKDSVLLHLEMLSRTLGLPTRSFRVDPREAMSGAAIAMERAELEDDRRGRERIFRPIERRVLSKSTAIYAAETGRKKAATLVAITFHPWDQTHEDGYVLIARTRFLQEMQAMSAEDAIRDLYPQATEKEVQDRLKGAADWRAQLAEEKRLADEANAEIEAEMRRNDPLAGLL
jgi:hypothetical protein